MRIHQVTVAGFGPFLAPQTVEFDAFDDHGIFLINGRTGAGKSSILDAIVYGLYNSTPRYGSGGASQVRSHHCGHSDPTWVELEFSTDGERYRVRRSPEYERPKSRGEGMTTERPSARLWRWEAEQWVGLEAQVRTVGQRLEELLPLSRAQFLQVVLLAQGEFQRFLVADSGERQDLLGALFDTRRFESFDALLQARATSSRSQLERADSIGASLVESLVSHLCVEAPGGPDDSWLAEVLEHSDVQRRLAEQERSRAQTELTRSTDALDEARRVLERQQRLAQYTALHDRLIEHEDDVAARRARLERARAAQAVRPTRGVVQRLVARAREADRLVDKAHAAYEELTGHPAPDELATEKERWASESARVSQALPLERQLRQAVDESTSLRRDQSDLERAIEGFEADLTRQRELAARSIKISAILAESAVHALLGELANARRHEGAVVEQRDATTRVLVTGQSRTAASARLDEVRRALHDQAAGRLAATLVPGQECPVCGSQSHPHPAVWGDDPVSDEDLERSEREFAAAQIACGEAEAALAGATARGQALAGSRTVEVLTDLVAEATTSLRLARDAEQARDAAEAAVRDGSARLQDSQVRLAGLSARIVGVERRVVELRTAVDEARNGADSVAERLADVEARRRVVDTLAQSRESQQRLTLELRSARADLDRVMAEAGLVDDADFVAAELPPDDFVRMGESVRAHEDQWAVVTANLADPELQSLPESPVELAPRAAAVAAATDAYRDAAAAAGVAEQRHRTTDDLVRRVREVWARSEDDRRTHETLSRLASTVHGEPPNTRRLRLESYVLAVQLEQIVEAANHRLAVMSAGRYELMLNDRVATRGNNAGLEVRVRDQHTQESRTPESLSGGEKFLASLALALGLAEVVTNRAGGIALHTLFIDEGFGSLDSETLDLAMHTLDSLRENGRTVGVISHVAAMKERIPAQVVVERAPGGWSSLRVTPPAR